MQTNLIYTVPWILASGSNVIRDGAIVGNAEQIVAVGPRRKITETYPGCRIIQLHGAIIPPLVNCHIHLELSHMRSIPRPDPGATMVDWIANVLQQRLQEPDQDSVDYSRHIALQDQVEAGVVLLADIGNTVQQTPYFPCALVERHAILEVLAPTVARTKTIIEGLERWQDGQPISPHSLYSTSADLIAVLKKRASKNNHAFSIHVAESAAEIELICHKSGVFRKFLEERNSWDGEMLACGNYIGAVDYLNSLGVLDERTICVHCVHVQDEELLLLARKKAKICLCPGSNEFLRVGRAPLEKMLGYNILPAIGTDSHASNESLDMWREMQILRRNHPSVSAGTIFSMATLGGAKALNRDADYGTLERAKRPLFLEIEIGDLTGYSDAEIFDLITTAGKPQTIRWVTLSDT